MIICIGGYNFDKLLVVEAMGLLFGSKDGHSKSPKPPKLAAGYYDPEHPYRYTRRKVVKDIKSPSPEEKHKSEEEDEDDGADDDPDRIDETELNTKLNALLYHTSDDSVAMYKTENTSSDLLGRLYYDDYDSESMASPIPSGANTPLLSPNHTGGTNLPPSSLHLGLSSINFHLSNSLTPSKPSFERGISFDTSDDHRKSLTFKVKHPHFKFRRNNNTFLTGFKNDTNSLIALEWLFDEMVIHGDSIIVLQVLDEKTHSTIDKVEANLALDKLESLNLHSKKISLVYEIVIGNTQKLLKAAIAEYKPAMMIMGTHETATDTHKSLLSKTSFAKNFLECALVPVILVKPDYHYIEFLDTPITKETYFEDLLKNIDISTTYDKKHYKPKNSKTPPMSARNLLSPSQSALSPSQTRTLLSPNMSPSTSRTDHSISDGKGHEHRLLFKDGSQDSSNRSRSANRFSSSRSDHSLLTPDGRDHDRSLLRDKSQERSTSRSRSATRLSRFFRHD